MQLHSIQPNPGARVSKRRVGRGLGSKRGKTAGRGTKGQRARAGGSGGLLVKGLRQTLLRVPKTRGFKSAYGKSLLVRVDQLKQVSGVLVTPKTLKKAGLITVANRSVKIVGRGEAARAYVVRGCAVTAGAKTQIEAAGGKIA